jgi:hypothetical protein
MRRLIFALAAVAALMPLRADALTVRDIVELSRAGLGDETLLALIEVDPSVFPIDTATLKSLKAAGVSEQVIVAMVRSARTPAPPMDSAPPEYVSEPQNAPTPVAVEQREPEIREVPVPVAVPVYIPVVRHRTDYLYGDGRGDRGDRSRDGRADDDSDRSHRKDPATVYWGFGGKLRPDAWQPR